MSAPYRLEVHDIQVSFADAADRRRALGPVNFTLGHGEILGVVGESGSGKSTLVHALLDLLPASARPDSFEVNFEGAALSDLSSAGRRELLGDRIAFIPQEPMTALNPTLKTGRQTELVLRRRIGGTPNDRLSLMADALRRLKVQDPERILSSYPFELSGGQIQRVLIAQALVLDCPLLLADEPTTALDVTIQAQVLSDLRHAVSNGGRSLLFISHSVAVVWSLCDRVLVMRNGEIVEHGAAKEVISSPRHAYTRKLLAALPSLAAPRTRLPVEAFE